MSTLHELYFLTFPIRYRNKFYVVFVVFVFMRPQLPDVLQPVGSSSGLVAARGGRASRNDDGKASCEICAGPPIIIPGPITEGLPDRRQEHLYR